MTTDDNPNTSQSYEADKVTPNRSSNWPGSIFRVPPAVERLFNQFPLFKYDENELPIRAPKPKKEHVLYVFATDSGARQGRPSFNPTCLKWQTYLKISGIPFRITSSSNHASPSGALPFLLPASPSSDNTKQKEPISTKRMLKWAGSQTSSGHAEEVTDSRYEAYGSLLDNRIRKAWLYQLYLSPANASVVHRLYVEPCSSNPFVRMNIAQQLHQAAASEIEKASTSSTLVEKDIMREAGEALDALSSILGDNDWFFGQQSAGLFDASVFAYTHLVQDDALCWGANPLLSLLRRHQNLLQHHARIANMYY